MPTLKEISARKRVAALALKLKLANRTKNNHEQILQSVQGLSSAQGFAASAPSFGTCNQGNKNIYVDDEADPNDNTSVISNTSDENLNVPIYRESTGNLNDAYNTSSLHSLRFHDSSEQPIVYGFGHSIEPSIASIAPSTINEQHQIEVETMNNNGNNGNIDFADTDLQFQGRSLKKRQVSHDSDDDEEEEDVKPYRSFMLDAASKVTSTLKTIKSFVSKSGNSIGLGSSSNILTIKDNQYPDIVAADGRLDAASLHDMHSVDSRSLQSTIRSSTPNRKGGKQSPVNHLQVIQENKQFTSTQSSAPVLVVKKPEMANQYNLPPKEATPVGVAPKKKSKSKGHDMVNSRNEPTIVEKLDVALNHLLLGPPKKLQPHDPEPWKPPEKHKIFSEEHIIRPVTTNVPEQFQSTHSVAEYQQLLSAGHFGVGSDYIHSNNSNKNLTIANKPPALTIPGIGINTSNGKYDPIFNKNLGNNLDTSNTTISTPTHQYTETFLSKTLNKAASMLSLPSITLHDRHYGHAQKVREDERSHTQSMTALTKKMTPITQLGGYADRHAKAVADTDPGKTPVVYSIKSNAQSSISAELKNQKTPNPSTLKADPNVSHANMSHWNSIHSAIEMHNSLNSWHDAAHDAVEPVSASAFEVVANYSKNPNSFQMRKQQARSELWNKLHNRYSTNESGTIIQEKKSVEHKEKMVQLHDDIMASYGEELGDWSFQNETDNSDWQEYWDEQAQAIYWYNHTTGEASWTSPALGLGKKSPKSKK